MEASEGRICGGEKARKLRRAVESLRDFKAKLKLEMNKNAENTRAELMKTQDREGTSVLRGEN